jgi:hypothetical protein
MVPDWNSRANAKLTGSGRSRNDACTSRVTGFTGENALPIRTRCVTRSG